MKFIFIAVNYNGFSHTKNYLNSIRELNSEKNDVVQTIIVDNNSSPQDVKAVRDYIYASNNEILVERSLNDGYFKGLNVGIKKCVKSEYTYIIVGNNDLIFDEDFIINLKKVSLTGDIQVIAPNVVTLDGRRQNPHVLTKVSEQEKIKARIYFSNYYIGQIVRFISTAFKSLLHRKRSIQLQPEYGQMKIKRGIGASYVLTPAFFKSHDQLDDRVFLWGEEALLSNQVESTGGATLYVPTLRVTHCESASVKFIESRKRYDIVQASYKIYRPYL